MDGSLFFVLTNGSGEKDELRHSTIKIQFVDFPSGAEVKNRLPMQGTRVRALVQEDPTCCGSTKPVRHNY